MTGVALPPFSEQFHLGSAEHGVIGAASLFGMVISVAFLIGLVFAPSYPLIVICLFAVGLALGCDYPTAHMIISESIPRLGRGKLVLGAFAFQPIGALAGTGVGCGVLSTIPVLSAWREFMLPTPATITNAAAARTPRTPANAAILAAHGFIPLPAHIRAMTHDQIEEIR